MRCNATIEVDGKTLTCELQAGYVATTHPWGEGEVLHRRDGLYWADDSPGAVPHAEPLTVGAVMKRLVDEAHERGPMPANTTWDFDATTDSDGAEWTEPDQGVSRD